MTTQYTLFSRVGRRRFARVLHITILFCIWHAAILVWPYYYGILTATIYFASRTSLHAHLHSRTYYIMLDDDSSTDSYYTKTYASRSCRARTWSTKTHGRLSPVPPHRARSRHEWCFAKISCSPTHAQTSS